MQHYDNMEWQPLMWVAMAGALVILCGIGLTIVQLAWSIYTRDRRRVGGDPWNGRSLEWSIPSPAPPYNFAVLPKVASTDAWWEAKRAGIAQQPELAEYAPIHMPRNSGYGFVTSFFVVVFGFAMIWHIWWMAIAGFVGIFGAFMVLAWRPEGEQEIGSADIARYETPHAGISA